MVKVLRKPQSYVELIPSSLGARSLARETRAGSHRLSPLSPLSSLSFSTVQLGLMQEMP